MIKLLKLLHWAVVASIPFFVWYGMITHNEIMTFYELKIVDGERGILFNDFEFYWVFLLYFTILVLIPLCIWNMYKIIKSYGAISH